MLMFTSKRRNHVQSAPYLFYMASRFGPVEDVFTNAQAVFNVQATSSQLASQTPWIEKALGYLSGRFLSDTTTSPQSTRVAILMVHGVVYLRGLTSSLSWISLMQPIDEYVERLEDSFILDSMRLFVHDSSVDSWFSRLASGRSKQVLDSSNSALAEGLSLVADGSGVLMLVQSKEAEIIAFVFDKHEVQEVQLGLRGMATLKLQSSTFLPLEWRSLLLSLNMRLSSGAVLDWLEYLQDRLSICG